LKGATRSVRDNRGRDVKCKEERKRKIRGKGWEGGGVGGGVGGGGQGRCEGGGTKEKIFLLTKSKRVHTLSQRTEKQHQTKYLK